MAVTVAWASGCNSNSIPSLATSISHRGNPKKRGVGGRGSSDGPYWGIELNSKHEKNTDIQIESLQVKSQAILGKGEKKYFEYQL